MHWLDAMWWLTLFPPDDVKCVWIQGYVCVSVRVHRGTVVAVCVCVCVICSLNSMITYIILLPNCFEDHHVFPTLWSVRLGRSGPGWGMSPLHRDQVCFLLWHLATLSCPIISFPLSSRVLWTLPAHLGSFLTLSCWNDWSWEMSRCSILDSGETEDSHHCGDVTFLAFSSWRGAGRELHGN